MSELFSESLRDYRTILVASGGAPHSLVAVARAARIVRRVGATLHLVAVVPQAASPLMNVATAFAGGEMFEGQAKQDDYAQREAYLQRAAADLRAAGLDVHAHLVPALKPADAIVQVAQEQNADLIILGRKHKSAWTAALAGSVSDMVSHASPVDVLIVR
ncbi:universal stress protein [Deinococcus fonticola]|uniref:universal stress protein n=1 Tax=Deinococcus fonticola TaxID=2528713 RepID=UPI00107527BC|nr:universal stress protein [Deinococcus fonticola]